MLELTAEALLGIKPIILSNALGESIFLHLWSASASLSSSCLQGLTFPSGTVKECSDDHRKGHLEYHEMHLNNLLEERKIFLITKG